MKFAFAAACLLGSTLAIRKFALADDSGLDHDNVTTADIRDDENGFYSDWGVDEYESSHVIGDFEDGEGWVIIDTLLNGGAKQNISKNDLYDETIFEGSNGVVFNVGIMKQPWPQPRSFFLVTLTVTCADGNVIQEVDFGDIIGFKNIELEADTTSCDITKVKVFFVDWVRGKQRATSGALWKDMELYVWNDSEVIEDHFWTNEDGYKVETELCFDMVSITSEQSVEFKANSSTPAFIDKADLVSGIELYKVTKDGEWIEQVAGSISAKAVGEAKDNIQSTLVYKQKVEEDTFYQLCFVQDQPDVEDYEFEAKAGDYQYGYHIYE